MFLGEMVNSWWEETEEKENSLKFEFQEDEWYREMKRLDLFFAFFDYENQLH